jgi:hypothetical protein
LEQDPKDYFNPENLKVILRYFIGYLRERTDHIFKPTAFNTNKVVMQLDVWSK